MEVTEVADTITEGAEEHPHHVSAEHEAKEKFRNRAALLIAVLAAVLAVGELGGDNAKDAMIYNNIKASDTWAFYQAKNVRQTTYKLAADALAREIPAMSGAARTAAEADLKKYKDTIARYESEPARGREAGQGKKELTQTAKAYEEAREAADQRNEAFDFAKMLMQLAIVLGSVSILALSRPLLWVAGGLGVLGAILTLDGFFRILPFHV